MRKFIFLILCYSFTFVSPTFSKELLAVRLQGSVSPAGQTLKNCYSTGSCYSASVDSRPNYFKLCPRAGCPGGGCPCPFYPNGCCNDYIEYFNAHVSYPGGVGCYDLGPPYATVCTPYTTQEPYPEANWPGRP